MNLMKLMSLLLFSYFSLNAHAIDFKCPPPAAYIDYKCQGSVTVHSMTELNSYLTNYGINKNKLKNLNISFNLSTTSNLNISTPCQVTISAQKQFSAENLCIHGGLGVVAEENFHFSGKDLRIESQSENIIKENPVINAFNLELVSKSLKGKSNSKIGEHAIINAKNMIMESAGRSVILEDAVINVLQKFGIYSEGDENAVFKEGVSVNASVIEVSSMEKLRIAQLVHLTALNEIILNADNCRINLNGTVLTAPSKIGSCFPAPTTTQRFVTDKTQGEAPLAILFDASQIIGATSYIWSFGNGTSDTVNTPTVSHTYSTVGTVTASLKYILNDDGVQRNGGSIQITVLPHINLAPVASITCDVNNMQVSCSGLGSYDPDGDPISYQLDFGDGATAISEFGVFNHTYLTPGVYQVTLTVKDPGELNSTASITIQANSPLNELPVPVLNCVSNVINKITCNPLGSSDGDGTIVSYSYEFDDGAVITQFDTSSVEHSYSVMGAKIVRLVVTDNDGGESFIESEFNVIGDSNPVADFTCQSPSLFKLTCQSSSYDPDAPNDFIQTLTWDLGNGETVTSTSNTLEYDYFVGGNYNITLTVTDSFGAVGTLTKSVSVMSNRLPIAAINCTTNNMLVSCNGLASYDLDGQALLYSFDYGDGVIEQNATGVSSHAYATAGTYNVTLTVVDILGGASQAVTMVMPVLPPNQLPLANLACSSTQPYEINCNALGSTDPDGSIVSYQYIWSDGASDTKSDQTSISHHFSTAGTKLIKLVVTDNDGGVNFVETNFNVKDNTLPLADFNCEPNYQELKIRCHSLSLDQDLGDSITSYRWVMGDGEEVLTTSPDVTHLYQVPGSYNVTLQVTDSYGGQSLKNKTFKILDSKPPMISFQYPSGQNFAIDENQNFYIGVTGLEALTADRFVLRANGNIVPNSHYSINASTNTINVSFPKLSYLKRGANSISIVATRLNGLSTESSVIYNVTDSSAPTIALSPLENFHFTSQNGQIEISVTDPGGIDWDTLSLKLENTPLDPSFYSREGDKIIINISNSDVIKLDENKFLISVSDLNGNNIAKNFSYFLDEVNVTLDFVPETNSRFESTTDLASVYPVSEDGSPLNWSTLKVYWNGEELQNTGYTLSSDKVSVPVSFLTQSTGTLKVSIEDGQGKVVSGEAIYRLRDYIPPQISFDIADSTQFLDTASPEILVSLQDDGQINQSNLSVMLNGITLPSSNYSYNLETNQITLHLVNPYLAQVGSNSLEVIAADLDGNLNQAQLNFVVQDTRGPEVLFSPQVETSFVTNYNTIAVRFNDLSEINWQSLRMDLDGVPVPLIYFSLYNNQAIINFNPDFSFELGENNINVTVEDIWGNPSVTSGRYNLLEKRVPQISYLPDRGTRFSSLPQTIKAKFNYPATVNWDSIGVKVNSVATSSWIKDSADSITLTLPLNSNMVQGVNLISLSYQDLEGNEVNDLVTYFLNDLSPPNLEVTPENNHLFATQMVNIGLVATDDGKINSESFEVILNGSKVGTDKILVSGNQAQASLSLNPGTNNLSFSVSDQSGKKTIVERVYRVRDTTGPTFKFSPSNWASFNSGEIQKFKVTMLDASGVLSDSIKVWLNGVMLPETLVSWSASSSELEVTLNSQFRLKGENNLIRVRASDSLSQISEGTVNYKLQDTAAPVLALIPDDGTIFINDKTPSIRIDVDDESKVNLAQAIYSINSVAIGASDTLVDTNNTNALISLTNHPLSLGANTFSVNVRDEFGNESIQNVTYNLEDTLAPTVSYLPASGTQFTSLDQSVRLTFSDLTQINWQSLILKLNDEVIPGSKYLVFGNDVIINFSDSYPFKQGANIISVNLADVSGNLLESSVSYTMDDVFPAEFAFTPQGGSQLASLSTPIKVTISDGGDLNWNSLELKLNELNLPSSQYLIVGNEITLNLSGNYKMRKGLNLLKVNITDAKGNLGSVTAGYFVFPTTGDVIKPSIAFSLPDGDVTETPTQITISVSDASGIDFSRMRFVLNNMAINESHITKDLENNQATIHFGSGLDFIPGKNLLTAFAVDNNHNVNGKTAYYNKVSELTLDLTPPTVTFNPGGGELVNDTPTVNAFLSDANGIDYSTLNIFLNDTPIDQSIVTVNQAQGQISLAFNSNYPIADIDSNVISIQVSDLNGNSVLAKVGFDRIANTTYRVVLYESSVQGGGTMCSILEGGLVRCWGLNQSGEAGIGTKVNIGGLQYPSSVPLVQTGEPVVSIANGTHTCAVTITGKLLCWGSNTNGELGLGHTNIIGDNELPLSQGYVDVGEKVLQVAVGGSHTCAVLESGNLKCWGGNPYGQTGRLTNIAIGDNELPSSIGSISFGHKVVQVTTTINNTCVLLENGKVKCFGRGVFGVNGSASTINTLGQSPANLADISLSGLVKEVKGSNYGNFLCAILVDGGLNCWGDNAKGQLGYGSVQYVGDNETPSSKGTVSLSGSVAKLGVGTNHACVLLSAGDVRCWGNGTYEENGFNFNLGDDELPSSVGVLNYGPGVVVDVLTGNGSSCLIFSNGTMKCWGLNNAGQLGQKTTVNFIGVASLPTMGPISLGGTISLYQQVYAYFDTNPYYGPSPLQVFFDATKSQALVGTISNYKFEFGDGQILNTNLSSVDHIYDNDGVYVAKLTVTNSNNVESSFQRTITVGAVNNKPIANFNINQDYGLAPFITTLDASSSFDVNGSIAKYIWNFGDGNTLEATSAITNHTYVNPGSYLVTLTVEDNYGDQTSAFPRTVTVKEFNTDPFANFNCASKGKIITCDATSSGDMDGYISSFNWDYGDGTTQTGLDQYAGGHNFAADGEYTVKLVVNDDTGSSSIIEKTVIVDSLPPVITSTTSDHVHTTSSSFHLDIQIDELYNTQTKVFRNNSLLFSTTDKVISNQIVLDEGLNQFKVESTDQNGNVSSKVILSDVILDTTAPSFITLNPASGTEVTSQTIPVTGSFNEKVVSVRINGDEATLSSDGLSFNYTYTTYTEDLQNLVIEAEDQSGNIATQNLQIGVFLKILHSELISIYQQADKTLKIVGSAGATKPQAEVEISSGFFNSESFDSNADGSFEITLNYFTSAKITVHDPLTSREESAQLNFNVDTTLAGTIRDIHDNPLPGVVVKIKDTDIAPVMTNASGIFFFANPPAGDRQLIIDGQNIPTQAIGITKKFSVLEMSVSIGSRQSNVLEKTIYLAPLMTDGTETVIEDGVGVTVQSSTVENATIDIPASVAVNFPEGNTTRAINMIEVPKDRTTVPVLKEAEPDSVVALEPSGLTFSEPVELTLPNTNELPAGMQVVIYSKNSQNGSWEIDGVARVSQDGTQIVTEEGMGITHFSEVYAAPLGLKYSQLNSQDKPGVDTFNGSVSTSLDFPGYKSLGAEIAPKLLYRSNWAHPTAIVTNMFNIPSDVTIISAEGRRVLAPVSNQLGYVKTWVVPESVDVSFITGDYHSPKMTLDGNPNGAVVSLAMDFINQATGVTPFSANYEIHLKRMVVRTTVSGRGSYFSSSIRVRETPPEVFPETIPSELKGHVYIQNKSNSSAGRGWMVGGVQKIVNPNSSRLMLEEENGQVSTYVVNDKIQILKKIPEGFSGLSSYGGNQISVATETNEVYQYDTEHDQISNLLTAPSYTGSYRSSVIVKRNVCASWTKLPGGGSVCFRKEDRLYCQQKASNYTLNSTRKYVIPSPAGNGHILATETGLLTLHNSGSQILAGNLKVAPNSDSDSLFCLNSASCSSARTVADFRSNSCPPNPQSTGFDYDQGFVDGPLLSARFNTIKSIAPAYTANAIAIADYGNHRVRYVDLDTGTVTTLGGNGKLEDSGDGGPALEAGIYHPKGVVFDEDGNLYVSTENGYIRKIDKSGRITNFAGNPNGVFYDSAKATDMYLSRPYGMVIDHIKSYMYVADTGNNRILQIDLLSGLAKTVAGNGLCQAELTTTEMRSALNSSLCAPEFVAMDDNHNLIIGDTGHKTIKKVIFSDSSTGVLQYDSVAEDNSELKRNVDDTFTRTFRNGTRSFFDHEGKLTRTMDRSGKVMTYDYDSNGDLIEQVDPLGGVVSYIYGLGGRLSTIRYENDNREFSFTYNSAGDLISAIYPDGSVKSFNYEADGLMNQEIDQRSNVTSYTYNSWKRLMSVTRPDGNHVDFTDSSSENVANNYVAGTTGQLKTFGNGTGQLVDGIKDAKGISTTFIKDETGYVSTIIDGENRTTLVERDSKGRPTKITRPDESIATFVYDQKTGDLLTKTDSSTGTTESYAYNSYGQLLAKTDGLGRRVVNEYDDKGLLTRSINETLGTSVSYVYNTIGQLLNQTNSLGQISSVTYDQRGNVQTATAPDGKGSTYSYYFTGLVHQMTDAKNNTTTYEYDLMNRLTGVTSAENERTQYQYWPTGELKKIIDPNGKETNFTYDSLGQLVHKVGPRGEVIQLAYDPNGNVAQEITPKGDLKQYQYDNLNQLTRKILPDDQYDFSYDSRGNVTAVTNAATQIAFTYQPFDGGDLVSTVRAKGMGAYADLPDTTMSYTYNEVGERVQMNTPVGAFSYGRDAAGRLRSVTNPQGKIFSFTYDLAQRLTQVSSPALITNLEYDSTGFNTKINHTRHSGATVERFIYGRDFVGNRVSKTTTQGTSQYSYDKNSQLLQAITPTLPQENFAYDAVGNRTQDNLGSYAYDSNKQQLVEDYKYLYVYDLNGNLISKQEKAFTGNVQNLEYTSENQLRKFKLYVGGVLTKDVTYTYDALGRRVEKEVIDHTNTALSSTKRFAYDGNEILAEYNHSNTLQVSYTHSGLRTDDVLSQNSSLGTHYFVKDGLGSITDITDESGNRVQHYEYSSFGKLAAITDGNGVDVSANPIIKPSYSYTGREFDQETGYYFYRARYYDPQIGRFLQVDPHLGLLSIPSTVNSSYVYVLNNPIRYTDPDGDFIAQIIIGGAIGGVVNALITASADKGNFFDNLFSKRGLSAFGSGFISGAMVTGGALLGAAFIGGIGGGAIGGAVGGVSGTFTNSVIDKKTVKAEVYFMSAVFGAIGGAFIGAEVSSGVAGGLSDTNKSAAQSMIEYSPASGGSKSSSGAGIKTKPNSNLYVPQVH